MGKKILLLLILASFIVGATGPVVSKNNQSPTLTLTMTFPVPYCSLHQDETAYIVATVKDAKGGAVAGAKVDFTMSPSWSNNVRNIGWMTPTSPDWPPNKTVHYGYTTATDLGGQVSMCVGSKNAETVVVTAKCTVAGVSLTASINVVFNPRPVEVKATSFTSTGDYILGWYWLRDGKYTHMGDWTFTGITSCPSYLLLRSAHLVTNTTNGGRGYSTWAKYQILHPDTGALLAEYYTFLLNLWSPADNTYDANGYNTLDSLCIPSRYVTNGKLRVRILRFSPHSEHIAVNKDSLILKTCKTEELGGIIGKIYDSHPIPGSQIGRPCSKVKVTVSGPSPLTVVAWSGETDDYGKFDTCYNLKPGEYIVTPQVPCDPQSHKVTVYPGKKTEISLICHCYGGITGYIGCEQGPCKGTTVNIYDASVAAAAVLVWTGVTDDKGYYDTCYNLKPGVYIVKPVSEKCKFSPESYTVEVKACTKIRVDFKCDCCAECTKGGIIGYIGCEHGPCKDTKVTIYDSKGVIAWTGVTDEKGIFDTCYNLLPGIYTVKPVSEKCKFYPEIQTVEVKACTKIKIEFKCDCCAECTKGGIIGYIGCDKGPCRGAIVYIYDVAGTTIQKLVTDDRGIYDTCHTLTPGTYTVKPVSEKCKFTPEYQRVEVKACCKVVVDFKCDCCAECTKGGIIGYIGCDKGPCKETKVIIYDAAGVIAWTGVTDEKGYYDTCYNLLPGTYIVKPVSERCKFSPESQKIEVKACNKVTVDFKCDCCAECTKGGIEGVVYDSVTNRPCPDVTVVVTLPTGEVVWFGKTDKDGKYSTCHTLNPGDYIIYAKANCEPKEQKVTVKACTKIKVDFKCRCEIKGVPLWLNPPKEKLRPVDGYKFKKSVEVGTTAEPVTNLMAAAFKVKFDPKLFQVLKVQEGPFLKQGGASTTFLYSIDNTAGEVSVSTTRLGGTGVSGYGTLAYIIFKVVDQPPIGLIASVTLPHAFSDLINNAGVSIPHYTQDEIIEFAEKVVIVGDLNNDGVLDIKDLVILALAYGHKKGDNGWDSEVPGVPGSPYKRADLWNSSPPPTPPVQTTKPDDVVSFFDVFIMVLQWGFYNP